MQKIAFFRFKYNLFYILGAMAADILYKICLNISGSTKAGT